LLTITEDTTLEAVFQRLPNALDDTEVPSTVDKIIRDGVLLIRRGGHLFDTLGRMQE